MINQLLRIKTVLRILSNTNQPILNYVWKAALLSIIPTLIISTAVTLALPDKSPSLTGGSAVYIIYSMLILGPFLETLFLWFVLSLIKRFAAKPTSIAIASAVFWGILHSLVAPAWGLIVVWPFFVFSTCFLEWEKKSKGKAIAATSLVHTCQNILPAIAIFVSS